ARNRPRRSSAARAREGRRRTRQMPVRACPRRGSATYPQPGSSSIPSRSVRAPPFWTTRRDASPRTERASPEGTSLQAPIQVPGAFVVINRPGGTAHDLGIDPARRLENGLFQRRGAVPTGRRLRVYSSRSRSKLGHQGGSSGSAPRPSSPSDRMSRRAPRRSRPKATRKVRFRDGSAEVCQSAEGAARATDASTNTVPSSAERRGKTTRPAYIGVSDTAATTTSPMARVTVNTPSFGTVLGKPDGQTWAGALAPRDGGAMLSRGRWAGTRTPHDQEACEALGGRGRRRPGR